MNDKSSVEKEATLSCGNNMPNDHSAINLLVPLQCTGFKYLQYY